MKYYSQLYSRSKHEATQKIEMLSHGLEQSLATFKEDLKNFKREENLKLEELNGSSDLSSWKKSIETKITRFCEEISCSMKGSKQYWRKEHDDLARDNL